MFGSLKAKLIIADHVNLPETILKVLETKKAEYADKCLWQLLNSEFKIKPEHFNAKVFAKSGKSARVMLAEPVTIEAGLNGAVITHSSPERLDDRDLKEIKNALSPVFADFDLQLELTDSNHFFVFGENIPDIYNKPAICLEGDIIELDRNQHDINLLTNHLQISLYNLPLNQKRSEQNLPEISSLWFWGACDYDIKPVRSKVNRTIYTDNPEVIIYAEYFSIPLQPLAEFDFNIKNALTIIDQEMDLNFWEMILKIPKLEIEHRGISYK